MNYGGLKSRLRPSVATSRPVLDLWKAAVGTIAVLGAILACSAGAQAEVVSPRRLLEAADLEGPVISPDGRRVAFRLEQASVERNTYDTAWYVQDLDDGLPPDRVADGGTPLREPVTGVTLPAPAEWSPEGRWIYYRALIDGRIAVWRAAADGSGAAAVTSDAADVRDFVLSADGKKLMYRVGATREEVADAEQAEYDRGIRIDETVPIGGGLFRSSSLDGRPATHRFLGDWFSRGPLLAQSPDRWKAVDTVSLKSSDLAAAEAPTAHPSLSELTERFPDAFQLSASPSDARLALLMRSPNEDDPAATSGIVLAMLPSLGAKRAVKCMAELCKDKPISAIQWRPGSEEILFTVMSYEDGWGQSLFRWDVATGIVRPVVQSRGLISGGRRHREVPCGVSFEALVCVAAEADRPPRLEAIDLATGHRRVLFEPNRALEADIARTAPAKLLRWRDAQGRQYTGQLFAARRTAGDAPPPLFVTYYTCDGFLRGGLGDEWPLATLAGSGISALCINGTPTDYSDRVDRFKEGPQAVAGAVALLSAGGEVDPRRVGMGGLSFGGEVALWTLMHSDLLSAASLASPATTPVYYLLNSLRPAFRDGLRMGWALGAPDETPERWREISPTFELDKIQAPVLFQLAEQEYILALDYLVPLLARSKADAYVFPNEPHIKFQPKHKLSVYERNLDWFRFWLQGYQDADPEKVEQYRIWSAMRRPVAQEQPASAERSGALALTSSPVLDHAQVHRPKK